MRGLFFPIAAMIRPNAALLLAALSTLVFGASGSAAAPQAGAGSPPNVVFMIADDLTAEALSVYGNQAVITPNIQRLAARGVVLDQAYCQYPVCAQSRASILSGRYTPELSSITNLDNALGSDSTWPEHFRMNGYRSERISKLYHMRVPGDITNGSSGPDHTPSWDATVNVQAPEWQTPGTAGHYSNGSLTFDPNQHFGLGFGAEFYTVSGSGSGAEQADWIAADQAVQKLAQLQGSPFFLGVGFVRPHVPLVAPSTDFALYDPNTIQLAASVPNDLADIPSAGVFWNEPQRGPNTDPDRREILRAYYAAVTFMDAQVGRVLDQIDALGLTSNTYIVFTSDHGYHLGEHTMWQKLSLHEESARVPLIIAGPGIQPGRRDALVEMIDLYPTFSELCGLPVPDYCSGKSLAGVLQDPQATVRDAAYSTTGNSHLIRTDGYAYMRYGNGSEELYDMSPAPFGDVRQFTNLVSDPAFNGALQDMRGRLDAKLLSFTPNTGEPYCDGDGSDGLCPCWFFGLSGAGCLTSSGLGARLTGSGSADFIADTFTLTVTDGPPGNFGFLFQGLTPTSAPLGSGILCMTVRDRLTVQALDAAGSTTYTGLAPVALAGTTMHYQYVFRDPAGPCGNGFNLTSAWRVTWR